MSDYTPKPDAPLPITLDGTEEWEITPLKFAEWLIEQYAKGEPVTILYPLPEKRWYKFVRWVIGIWNKLTGWLDWLKQEVEDGRN